MARRILSIDGGGIRGVFPAAFLAALEEDLDEPLYRYFDLIAGTSTGGIIAIGLALGLSAREILDLYLEHGPKIFGQDRRGAAGSLQRGLHNLRWMFLGPKYSEEPLRDALHSVLAEKRIGDAKTRLFIPAWNGTTKKVYIYKTAHHERLSTDYKDSALDAAMATAAAPTYFRQHMTENDVGLVDGGLWANNPVGFAVAEATATLGWPADDLKVLSVSCLENVSEMSEAYSALSIAQKTADFFIAGQSHASLGLAHILTGDPHERSAIHRVCQPVPDGFYSLDNTARMTRLKGRGFAEAREQKPILSPIFFDQPTERFEPMHPRKGVPQL